ncbi:MAG: ABC transporter permease, partial [Pusillimonas sp.]
IIGQFYFPPLSKIAAAAVKMWFSGDLSTVWLSSTVATEIVPSLIRLAAGFAIAAAVGIILGFAIGRSKVLADYVDLIVHVMRSVPPVALVPIFMLLFGLGTQMRVLLIAFTSVWPILLNTIDGAREVEPTYLDTARVFGISRSRRLRSVILPSCLTRIFDGLRISSALALVVMVVSEMFAATNGIGYSLVYAQQSFRYNDMWAYVILLGILGWLLNLLLRIPERVLLRWQPQND